MSTLEALQDIIHNLQIAVEDADKFDKGNAAAGTRVRTAAMQAKKDLDVLRKSVQETKNARKNG